MALATCELIWFKHLHQELRFGKDEQMKLICDNQVALHISSTQFSMREPNTSKWIAPLSEKKLHRDA